MKTAISHLKLSRRLNTQRGASLLEGIAYLGIAAIVVLGAVSLLTTAFGSAKSNQTSEEVIALRTAVRKLYAGQGYGTASLIPTLNTAQAIPGTLAHTGTTITNGWGGDVAVDGVTGSFTITYNAVPQDVCVTVISGATGWQAISANGGADIATFPATATDATGACTKSDSGGNTIKFTAS
jgi:type II secretory pathway pseudopilin PulG